MFSTKHLLSLLAVGLHAGIAACEEYGSWHVQINLSGGAQGHRLGELHAVHSSTPNEESYARWLYDPAVGYTVYTAEDPTLNNTWIDSVGVHAFEIQQEVLGVPLKGSGPIEIFFNTNGNGRSAFGNATIPSQLDN
ncbi:unnamed protein product [Colletotrichum noveboracense]|uniref:Uncharacterized protein n=1 Tax=Colletotrichum noveboracense TaxID=2664923 RepID=A0A9W4W6L0_9PEZI|nr:hypothetical protein K456DRAFT_32863 [Colletotrichum gloeosporioides 23]KAJ0275605.1 hypothetical protein COL940_008727 [Colletotrichum noveboracense]KAJ0282642.1 hypothetical protein CBS470a_007701 [Colletotrichum nupharicola]KAJ0317865.1 hypothetical protein Brms1b_004682 [Colletotrichum noveboracense]CAI0641054.1 unnamed protein product [Colletotrichum noveboracense]